MKFDSINRINKTLARRRSSATPEPQPVRSLLGSKPVRDEGKKDQLAILEEYIQDIRKHKESILRGSK